MLGSHGSTLPERVRYSKSSSDFGYAKEFKDSVVECCSGLTNAVLMMVVEGGGTCMNLLTLSQGRVSCVPAKCRRLPTTGQSWFWSNGRGNVLKACVNTVQLDCLLQLNKLLYENVFNFGARRFFAQDAFRITLKWPSNRSIWTMCPQAW